MRLPVYADPADPEPIFWLGDESAKAFDIAGHPIGLDVVAGIPEIVYADVPIAFYMPIRGGVMKLAPRRAVRDRRAAFLAGEGTLTVEDVRVWARDLGLAYELDGCKDPTPKLMVAVVPEGGMLV